MSRSTTSSRPFAAWLHSNWRQGLMGTLTCLTLVLLLAHGGTSEADDEKKAPAKPSFKADGRAGNVVETQGSVLIRPGDRQRWSPLGPKDLIFPGDRVRTAFRGAHAVELQLSAGTVLMGPGTEVEVTAGSAVRLIQGDVEFKATKQDAPLAVTAPGGHTASVAGTQWLSTEGREKTRVLDKLPRWVESYRASASNEWMGALMTKVDGRDVPLAVGYHNVDVEIRDQIARTTIEQSFINSTRSRMEGVFYFPMPPGASISGFGMWIGGELVEADIVEKQRAREIYEDILRKKKDPGLLEWEGGNLFKARVFPIEAHSEKRIRIRYTQVLPREGNSYRYRYALRSELLTRKPLRELKMAVRIMSTAKLGQLSCQTHDTTIKRLTDHEASVHYEAREYSPTQDFEVRVNIDAKDNVVVVPHRRGEDGYFMVQLMPPSPEATGWQRDLVPDGNPLKIILVADTSGSMDVAARKRQDDFMRALVSLLGPKDEVSILAYDVAPVWITPEAIPAEDEDIFEALDRLQARDSLGWSNIPAAISAATTRLKDGGLVIYIGDGIGTQGDGDPVGVAANVVQAASESKATVHAVAPSSSYESGVLEALASIGAGSMRVLDPKPLDTAAQLLREAVRPSLRDMRVEIEGIKTARVYPQTMPNLPEGRQMLVLGRFLPSDVEQQGTVRVKGTLSGAPVSYTTTFKIPAADVGNSFLPRLWARMHLDALLAQGSSKSIREEIIEFSERFSIMTPYTSFLVLESDAQRAEYGVTRRVRMRDGERFFATARDKVALEERRSALKVAGRWRQKLRHSIMREIAAIGRYVTLPGYSVPGPMPLPPTTRGLAWGIGERAFSAVSPHGWALDPSHLDSTLVLVRKADVNGNGIVTPAKYDLRRELIVLDEVTNGLLDGPFAGSGGGRIGLGGGGGGAFSGRGGGRVRGSSGVKGGGNGRLKAFDSNMDRGLPSPSMAMPTAGRAAPGSDSWGGESEGMAEAKSETASSSDSPTDDPAAPAEESMDELDMLADKDMERSKELLSKKRKMSSRRDRRSARNVSGPAGYYQRLSNYNQITSGRAYALHEQPSQRLYVAPGVSIPALAAYASLGFPTIPGAPKKADEAAIQLPEDWDAEAVAFIKLLHRRAVIDQLEGGIHVTEVKRSFRGLRKQIASSQRFEGWIGGSTWVLDAQRQSDTSERRVDWLSKETRGAWHMARGLGASRNAEPTDAATWHLPFWDMRYKNLPNDWARLGLTLKLVSKSDKEVVIMLGSGKEPCPRTRLKIDPTRNVVTEMAYIDAQDKVISRTTYAKFVEIAGRFFEQEIKRYDSDDRMFTEATRTIESIDRSVLDSKLAELASTGDNQLSIRLPLPSRTDAKQAVADGKAKLEDHLVVLLQTIGAQQWDDLDADWNAFAAVAGRPTATSYVELAVRSMVRKNETLLQLVRQLVPVASAHADSTVRRFLATWFFSLGASRFGANELLDLLDQLKTSLTGTTERENQEDARLAVRLQATWLSHRARHLRQEDARSVRTKLAELLPFNVSIQLAHENDLFTTNKRKAALAFLEQVIENREPWTHQERSQLYQRWTDRLWTMRDLPQLATVTAKWVATKPEVGAAYIRHWSALYFIQREAEADEEIQGTLALLPDGSETDADIARIGSALRMALGGGWHFQMNVCPVAFRKNAASLIHHIIRANVEPFAAAWGTFTDWRFRQTDEFRKLQKSLQADAGNATWIRSASARQISHLISHLPWSSGAVDREQWNTFYLGLRERWQGTEDWTERNTLSDHILALMDAQGEQKMALDFLRARLARTKAPRKHSIANTLVDRLYAYSKKDETLKDVDKRESELMTLIPLRIHPKASEGAQKAAWAGSIAKLSGVGYDWRNAVALGSSESRKKLTRKELKQLTRDAKRAAREQMVVRLQTLRTDVPESARRWVDLERLTFAAELATDLPAVVAEAKARFAAPWERKVDAFDHAERRRLAAIMTFAAVKRNAPKGWPEELIRIFEAGRKTEAALLAKDKATISLLDWPYHLFRLFVALDRPEELIKSIELWDGGVADSKVNIASRWLVALGYTEAELGRLEKGARHFEAVRAKKELGGDELGHLARWYLVLNKDDARRGALDARYESMNEWALANLVDRQSNRVRRSGKGIPATLDAETFSILRVLMKKSQHPNNHRWRIRNLYRTTKDHRVLGATVTHALGHTKERTYRFLNCMNLLIQDVHEEATCDELTTALATLRKTAKSAVDRRAMSLLTSMVESRASKVLEKDTNHRELALVAFREAFKNGTWEKGEPRLMANFLYAIGRPGDRQIEEEQLRQLKALAALDSVSPTERAHVGTIYAKALWRAPSRRSEAVRVLADVIQSARKYNSSHAFSNDGIPLLATWMTSLKRFRDAERVLNEELARHDNENIRQQLEHRLLTVYVSTLREGGAVSLGQGKALYDRVLARIHADIEANPTLLGNRTNLIVNLHRAADKARAFRGVGLELETYARGPYASLWPRVPLQQSGALRNMAAAIHKLRDARYALEYILDCLEKQPAFLKRLQMDLWNQSIWQFAKWRKQSGSQSERLWALVKAEYEAQLLGASNSRGSNFWGRGNSYEWTEKRPQFIQIAVATAESHGDSPSTTMRCAHTLRNMAAYADACTVLASALSRGKLNDAGQWTLATWYRHDRRFTEGLELGEKLVARRPEHLQRYLLVADCLGGLKQKDRILSVLKSAETYFRNHDETTKDKRTLWRAEVAGQLGTSAITHKLDEAGAAWIDEALRLLRERNGNRGGRNHQMMMWYRQLAMARTRLGDTKAAVSAATAALASTPARSRNQRRASYNTLVEVFKQSTDLAAYAKVYDAEVEVSSMDSALVRQAFADAYLSRKDYTSAERQLALARELDPRDEQVLTKLLTCYDALNQRDKAMEVLLASAKLSPRNLAAYEALQKRFGEMKDAVQQERAATTLVEVLPKESDGHHRLALIRQAAQKQAEANRHWNLAATNDSKNPARLVHLARGLIRSGDHADARSALNKVLQGTWLNLGSAANDAQSLLKSLP